MLGEMVEEFGRFRPEGDDAAFRGGERPALYVE